MKQFPGQAKYMSVFNGGVNVESKSGHKALRAFRPAALGRDFDRFFISALHRLVVMST